MQRPLYTNPPISPFFYTPLVGRSLPEDFEPYAHEVTKRLLSNPSKYVKLNRIDGRTVYDIRHFSKVLGDDAVYENQVRFIERLSQDYGFKHNDDHVSVLAFDVEASSKGQFPNAATDHTLTMAVYSRNREESIMGDEQSIYEAFCDVIQRSEADLIATYSGTAFDYKFPLDRCHNLDMRFVTGKLDDEPYIKSMEYGSGRFLGQRNDTFMHGRISFDVYHEVLMDTNLSGIRRGLKDVGKHYYPEDHDLIVELDRQRLKQASKSELGDYCLSDARLTYKLATMYLETIKSVAIDLKMPLDMVVNRRPSHIGNIMYGREFNKLDIVSDGANFERYTGILWETEDEDES